MGHGLKVAGNAAIGLGELHGSETAGDLLFDLAHSQVAFGAVIGEGDMRQFGKEQHRSFMLFQRARGAAVSRD